MGGGVGAIRCMWDRKEGGEVRDTREASEKPLWAGGSAWKCLSGPKARPVISPSTFSLCKHLVQAQLQRWLDDTLSHSESQKEGWYYTGETKNKNLGENKEKTTCLSSAPFKLLPWQRFDSNNTELKLSASPLLKSLPLPPVLPFTLLFTHPDSTLLLCSVHLSSLLLHISVHFSHHLFPISRLSHLLYYHSLASLLLFSTSSPLLPVTSPILLSSLSFSTSFALPV